MATSRLHEERLQTFLRNSTFLGCLSDDVLGALVRRGRMKTYARGEVVCRSGEAGDTGMIVLSGRLKVGNATPDGQEIGLNFLGPGDLAGEIALLDGQERTATVSALEDSEVFVVERKDLLPVLKANPEAMLEIIQTLCQKLRTATSIIEDSALEMQARVARGLLRLARQHGVMSRNRIRIELKLSQSELGNYLGVSRPNVNRQLARLKDLKAIEVEGAFIVVLDEVLLVAATMAAPDSSG